MCVSKESRKFWRRDDIGEPTQNVGKVTVGKYLARIVPVLS